jgi:DNA polymerase family A
MIRIPGYANVVAADFEYSYDANGLPLPFCYVEKNLTTGHVTRLWGDELQRRHGPPTAYGPQDIFVCYSASAEGSAYHALGWPRPPTIIDLYAEWRLLANGRIVSGFKQTDALQEFNLPYLDVMEKAFWQQRAVQGPPFDADERQGMLDYCESDSIALERLLPAMLPFLNLPQAHLRGRYMWNLAAIQRIGIPVDLPQWTALNDQWDAVIDALIEEFDEPYHVYHTRQWSHAKWLAWCEAQGIEWPLTTTGRAETKTQTWLRMADQYPAVANMAELFISIGLMDEHALQVSPDGRHRPWLNPFGTLTGRNMPSPKFYLFGAPSWLRRYIQAPTGHAVVYLDYRGQEIAIAAALSDDPMLKAFYRTGDPYLAFGHHCGLIPLDVTIDTVKQCCPKERDLCKTLLLGVGYGMSKYGFSQQAKISLLRAETIIDQHKRLFPRFWRWIKQVVETAYGQGFIASEFGWRYHNVVPERRLNGKLIGTNPRTLMDFPAQANGAEIMRLAASMLVEAGYAVGGVVHDAFMLTIPLDSLQPQIAGAKRIMERASEAVLDGYTCFVDDAIFPYPTHYQDGKGQKMWQTITRFLSQLEVGGGRRG